VPKRRERVAPPPASAGWDIRYGTSDATHGWDQVCSAAPANARVAWEQIVENPGARSERQHPLRGALANREVNGQVLEQWQYEVTGAGRVWYCIDEERRTVWLMDASVGHPKATE
jgi:hypothetical protein